MTSHEMVDKLRDCAYAEGRERGIREALALVAASDGSDLLAEIAGLLEDALPDCEACGNIAAKKDVNSIPLCAECWGEMLKEAAEAENKEAANA